jgi:hypothetical protein
VIDSEEHPIALVVDEEQLLRWFAAGLLEDHGFKVIEAESSGGAEGARIPP